MSAPVKTRRSVACGVAGLLLSACLALPATSGQQSSRQDGVPAAVLDANAIQQWADQAFGQALAEHRFSGLGIVVTKDDKVVFLKGYGFQDWATKVPVVPDKTQFRIASLTKTFTGTAVVQLLERGLIASLDDPANKYLKRIQLPQNRGQDIRVWDLISHRAGFAGSQEVEFTEAMLKLPAPAALLAAHMPAEYAHPRDSLTLYCNYCAGTAGILVEDVSGKPLPEYLRENVFAPLGMDRTEMRIVRTPNDTTITQYAFIPGGPAVALPYPNSGIPLSPGSGTIISTPADMGKWLIAHVQEGQGTPKPILSPKSFQLMHTRRTGNHPETSGNGAAFFIYDYNGEKVMEHYGSMQHRSMEFFLMDSKVGIFVTIAGGGAPNAGARITADGSTISGEVEPAISHSGVRALVLDHFLGALPFQKDMKVDLTKYVGRYRDIPREPDPDQDPEVITVAHSGNGGLIIGGRGVYRPSSDNVFTLDHPLDLEAGFGDANRYVFGTDAAGNVTRMYQHINAGGYDKLAQ